MKHRKREPVRFRQRIIVRHYPLIYMVVKKNRVGRVCARYSSRNLQRQFASAALIVVKRDNFTFVPSYSVDMCVYHDSVGPCPEIRVRHKTVKTFASFEKRLLQQVFSVLYFVSDLQGARPQICLFFFNQSFYVCAAFFPHGRSPVLLETL